MPQGEERGPSQGGGRRPGKQKPRVRAAGGIQINKKIEGRGGVKYVCVCRQRRMVETERARATSEARHMQP